MSLPLQSLRWILLLETNVTKIKDLPSEFCGKFPLGLWNYLASELEASRSIWCCDIVRLIISFECFGIKTSCPHCSRRQIVKQPMFHLRWGCGHRLVEPQLCWKTVPTRFIRKFHVTSRSILTIFNYLDAFKHLGAFSEVFRNACQMTGFHFCPTNVMFFEQQTASKKCSKGKQGRVEMGAWPSAQVERIDPHFGWKIVEDYIVTIWDWVLEGSILATGRIIYLLPNFMQSAKMIQN